MTNVVIASAARTAVGSFSGSFGNTPAHELGTTVLEALVSRAGIDKSEVSETIMGQVLTAGQGQNPARQAHVNAGLPVESAAWGINQVCGSGLRAVALAAQHIQLGDASIICAGGQENMSLSPHVSHLRSGHKMGDVKYIDSMIKDGLWDAFNGYHMGQTAENVAEQWQISRDMQDEFALSSQNKAEAAQVSGKFEVMHNNKLVGTLFPEKRLYPSRNEVTTEASIKPTLFNDFYIVLGNKLDENAWVVRTYIKPFISFIWIGVILISLGGFISLLPFNSYRNRSKA